MRIAIVVSTFPPYQGGMGNMARAYAEALAARGHAVEVFTPARGGRPAAAPSPFKIRRLRSWGRFRNSAFLPQLAWALSDFDVLNLHYPFYGGAEVVWLRRLAPGAGPALVLNYQMDNLAAGALGAAFRWHARHVAPRIVSAADRVIVTSLDYAEHSIVRRALLADRRRLAVIPPAVDTARFAPRPRDPDLLRRYAIGPRDPVVLFVGGLDRAHAFKGIPLLLEAWARLSAPGAKLLLVGRGDLRPAYLRMASSLGLEACVRFADDVGPEDLPGCYNLADLAVLPSLDASEAFGLVLLEAMASGVPVAASSLPGVRSVVDPGRTGVLFPPRDAGALRSALAGCLADRDRLAAMGRQARERAVSVYGGDVVWPAVERTMFEAAAE